jgi:NTE family protein
MLTSEKRNNYDKNDDLQYMPETILINQGGGSLGAYECGVSKVLAKHQIHFDIIAGASIGAINATILAAGYSQKYGIRNSVHILENFWMDLAEKIIPIPFCQDKQRSELAALSALYWGNPKAFTPIWINRGGLPYYYFFNSPYIYDIDRLKNTINKYVDFTKFHIKKNQLENKEHDDNTPPRLIITATNIQTGEPVTFDSYKIDITVDHVMAGAGYAVYGLPWTKINDSYMWDGSFVHNTPLKAVINASPRREKIAYISDVFPLKQKKLPNSMPETYHRVRDLLFHDISIGQISEVSDMVKKHLSLLEQMHEIIVSNSHKTENKDKDAKTKASIEKIEKDYNDIISNGRGHIMEKLIHIQRKESMDHHFIFEDADFSIATIKRLIQEGEKDAEESLLANEGQRKKGHL